jgi:hypothetical protein
MSSHRPPSGLHQSRRKNWGKVYRATDSGNNNENNKDDDVDDDDILAAADSNDDDNEDNENTDVPVPHSAAAASSPLATIADVGSIINPYVGRLVLRRQLCTLSTSDNALPSSWSVQFRLNDNCNDDLNSKVIIYSGGHPKGQLSRGRN